MQDVPAPGFFEDLEEWILVKHLKLTGMLTVKLNLPRLLRLAPHLQCLTLCCRSLNLSSTVGSYTINRSFRLLATTKKVVDPQQYADLQKWGLCMQQMGKTPAGTSFLAVCGDADSEAPTHNPTVSAMQKACGSMFHRNHQSDPLFESYLQFVKANPSRPCPTV